MAPIFGYLGDRYSRKYIMAAGQSTKFIRELTFYKYLNPHINRRFAKENKSELLDKK